MLGLKSQPVSEGVQRKQDGGVHFPQWKLYPAHLPQLCKLRAVFPVRLIASESSETTFNVAMMLQVLQQDHFQNKSSICAFVCLFLPSSPSYLKGTDIFTW